MNIHKNSIALIIPYFGKWPEWIDLFFYSCEQNNTIDFVFFTDCSVHHQLSENIKLINTSYADYCKLVSEKLDIKFFPKSAYKLCDLKPFYGYIHYEVIKNYSFYGFADLDLCFGDIRSFYTDEILEKYDVLSTHDDRIAGHLNLFRNNDKNRMIPFEIPEWKNKLEQQKMVTITENFLTRLYFEMFTVNVYVKKFLWRFIGRENVIIINGWLNKLYKRTNHFKKKRLYFKEQYTTPLSYVRWIDGTFHDNQPDIWYYKDGDVTNNRDVGRKFIYIHFMNFKSGKYRKDGKDLWSKGFYQLAADKIKDGVEINKNGIIPMNQ